MHKSDYDLKNLTFLNLLSDIRMGPLYKTQGPNQILRS